MANYCRAVTKSLRGTDPFYSYFPLCRGQILPVPADERGAGVDPNKTTSKLQGLFLRLDPSPPQRRTRMVGMMEQNGFPFQLCVKALTTPPANVARTNYLFRSPSNLMYKKTLVLRIKFSFPPAGQDADQDRNSSLLVSVVLSTNHTPYEIADLYPQTHTGAG